MKKLTTASEFFALGMKQLNRCSDFQMGYDSDDGFTGLCERAATSFGHAIRLDPAHADAYLGKGEVLMELGRHDEAMVAYKKALELDPKSEAREIIEIVLAEKKKRAEAAEKKREERLADIAEKRLAD